MSGNSTMASIEEGASPIEGGAESAKATGAGAEEGVAESKESSEKDEGVGSTERARGLETSEANEPVTVGAIEEGRDIEGGKDIEEAIEEGIDDKAGDGVAVEAAESTATNSGA